MAITHEASQHWDGRSGSGSANPQMFNGVHGTLIEKKVRDQPGPELHKMV